MTPPDPAKGRAIQSRRREIKTELKDYPLEEDAWYEILEDRAVAKLPWWTVVEWTPALGQGHAGKDTVLWRISNGADVAPTRLCGDLTLRQCSALVREILKHQPRRHQ